MSKLADLELVIAPTGNARCIYDELLDLRQLGRLTISRASHVEPDDNGYWWADMQLSGGPVLGPYSSRSEALEAEKRWLTQSSNHDGHFVGSMAPLYGMGMSSQPTASF